MIERCAGIPTGLGFLVGGGYYGKTKELDDVVQREAEILQELYGMDIQIRFNSNRESGGAWVIDGRENSSIGLSASLRNSKLFHMSCEEILEMSEDEFWALSVETDVIVYETYVDYYNTNNTLDETDIRFGKAICCDFADLNSAINYLQKNVSGLKES